MHICSSGIFTRLFNISIDLYLSDNHLIAVKYLVNNLKFSYDYIRLIHQSINPYYIEYAICIICKHQILYFSVNYH